MRAIVFCFLLVNAGCLRRTEFQCTDDSSCGAAGRCEATSFCSFGDTDCSTGRRYDASAGALAGQCTGDDVGTDSGVTPSDGSTTDTPKGGCPNGYVTLPGGQSGHFYKLVATAENWQTQEDGCQQTSAVSHLAVPDDLAELVALGDLAASNFWLGITDSAVEGTWRTVLNTTQTFLPWQPPAPDNNAAGQGEDCVEGLPPTDTLNDRRCMDKLPAVCECVP